MGFPSLRPGASIKGSLQLLLLPSVSQSVQVLMMDVKVPCLLLCLLTNLNLCFGQYWSPIIDNLERVQQVAGTCWMTLNLYPLEESVDSLSSMFGEKSTNRESLSIFIIALQSIRVKLDHMKLEMIMQDYDCHFQEQRLLSGPYFDYLGNFLRLADREIFDFSCVAPPCPSTQPTHTTTTTAATQGTSQPPQCLRTQQTPEVREEDNSRKRTTLFFVVIPFTACVAVLMWMILKAPCLLLSLVTSLNLCSGKFGSPITDDVNKLPVLKQNIPYDYEIPVSYIPKEVAGTCWVVLNIYPLEQSLRKLANMFGTISSNKDNILLFIAMLKSLRFTFDHDRLETAMQSFQCHYQEQSLLTGPYFDYIRDFLHTAAQGTPDFSCEPPPCLSTEQTPGVHEENRGQAWSRRSPLLLVLIPFIACVALIVWLVKSGRRLPVCNTENSQMEPSDMIPTVSISIPLQTLTHAADAQPEREAIAEHESG